MQASGSVNEVRDVVLPGSSEHDAGNASHQADRFENPLLAKMARIFSLTPAEREALLGACDDTRQFGAREDIIQRGDRPWQSNLLLSGMICRYRLHPAGRRQILAFQYPGDVFDSYSFILEVMDHSIAALSPCTIAVISHDSLFDITEKHPRLTRALWKETLIDAAVFAEWMTNVRSKIPDAQIAHLICEIFTRVQAIHRVDEEGIEWPITAEDIADALTLSADFVRTTMEHFRSIGWISRLPNRMLIHNFDALRRLADFDPAYLHYTPPMGPAGRTK